MCSVSGRYENAAKSDFQTLSDSHTPVSVAPQPKRKGRRYVGQSVERIRDQTRVYF